MNVNMEYLKCALVLGILFFVLSHPYLYRALHKVLKNVVAMVDDRMCPTELGVLLHAVVFALIVYFGKKLYDQKYGKKKPTKPSVPLTNEQLHQKQAEIPRKCQVYCEKISNKIQDKINANNNRVGNNAPRVNNNGMGNNGMNNNNNGMMNNNNGMMNNNNVPMMNNNNGMNNNVPMVNNNAMGNNMGFDDMVVNTLSQNNNNNNSLGCGMMSDFTNQINSGNMFSENTTYVDDMYSSVNF